MANPISSFFHPEDAYKAAEREAEARYREAQGFQKPYWQQGVDQTGRLNDAENNLLNPAQLESQWAQGYQESPFAQQLLAKNRTAGLDAASSMGLMGSSAALNNIQTGAGNIVSQDRQQFLNDLMQKYMTGIGLGQNIYGIGAQTGANLGSQAMQEGENMAGLQYGRTAAPGQLFGNILGKLTAAGMNYNNPQPNNLLS